MNFIIVTSILEEFSAETEDELLRDLSKKDLGLTTVLVNINQIEHIFGDVEGSRIILISGNAIQTKEPFDELITKISTAQIKSRIN